MSMGEIAGLYADVTRIVTRWEWGSYECELQRNHIKIQYEAQPKIQ